MLETDEDEDEGGASIIQHARASSCFSGSLVSIRTPTRDVTNDAGSSAGQAELLSRGRVESSPAARPSPNPNPVRGQLGDGVMASESTPPLLVSTEEP